MAFGDDVFGPEPVKRQPRFGDDVFGPEPAETQAHFGDDVFGPEPAETQAHFGDDVFGPDPVRTSVDFATQWIPGMKEAPSFPDVVQRARGSAYKSKLRDAAMMEDSLKNLEKLADKQAELQATAQTPRAREAIDEIVKNPRYMAPPQFVPPESKFGLAELPGKISQAVDAAKYRRFYENAQKAALPFIGQMDLMPPELYEAEGERQRKAKRFFSGKMEDIKRNVQKYGGPLGQTEAGPVRKLHSRMPDLEARVEQESYENPLVSLDKILGAPFRVVAGGVQAAQDWLDYLMTPEGFHQEAPQGALKTIWESLTYEKPIYMANVFENAARQIAARDLTQGERVLAHIAGLGAELVGTGKLLELSRLGRGGPEAVGMARHARGALKAGGGLKVEKQLAQELGEAAAGMASHPERISALRSGVRELGKHLGASPEVVAEIDRQLLRRIGPEGRRLGKTTWIQPRSTRGQAMRRQVGEAKRSGGFGHAMWQGGEKIPGVPQKLMEATPERLVPFGARPSFFQKLTAPASKEVFYGGGAVRGVEESMRVPQGYRQAQTMEGIKGGLDLEKMVGSAKRSQEVALVQDLHSFRQRNIQEMAELQTKMYQAETEAERLALQQQMAQKARGFEKAVSDTEAVLGRRVHPAEIEAGVVPRTAKEAQALDEYQKAMENMLEVERSYGLNVGEVEEYLPHVMTKKARRESLESVGPGKSGGPGFQHAQHRVGTEAGITLAHPEREFMRRLGDQYLARKMAHAVAVSNKMAERQILQGYGKLIPEGPFSRNIEKMARKQGLVEYNATNGRKYLLDKGTAHMLEKMINPDQMGKILKTFSKFSNWWKSRATVLRPGFVFRNVFFGNVWQMWLADTNITKSIAEAARLQAKLYARSPVGRSATNRAIVEQLFGKSLRKGGDLGKIGKYTYDEVLDLALQNKVVGGGFFGQELGQASGSFMGSATSTAGKALENVNPLGKSNVLMKLNAKMNRIGEDNARLAMFADRLRKGYSPREAARDVAKYIFNYDELARFGQAARHILPFFTWNWKNWGLQISSLLTKPDKFSKFVRGWTGTQELDPLTEEERIDAMSNPQYMEEQGAYRLPFVRGAEEGGRMYALGAGLFPMMSLKQIGAEKLAKGEVGDFGLAVAKTVGEMLHPVFRATSAMQEEAESGRGGYWGTPPRLQRGYYNWAPTWVAGMMEYAKENAPDAYDVLSEHIRPVQDPATGTHLGYKWLGEVDELIQAADPGLATVNRVFRSPNADKAYDTLIATILGVKPFEMTKGRRLYHQVQQQEEDLEKLKREETVRKQLGEQIDERNQYRNYPSY